MSEGNGLVRTSSNEPPSRPLQIRASELKQVDEIRALSSVLLDRLQFFRQAGISFEGARDLYQVLGYDRVLTYRKFRSRYQRNGIAKRIVEAYPKATWRGGVELYEDEDPDTSTAFEEQWDELEKRLSIWSMLQRVDILAGLSTYAVILIGAPGDLSEELPRGNGTPDQLFFIQPFSGGGGPGGDRLSRPMSMDADCSIMTFCENTADPRFGQPNTYQLKRTNLSAPMLQRPVHWSRVIHIAEGLLNDEVYGSPTLESVWNLLDDLDKVTGGGAEAFWLRANPGLHLDIAKDMALGAGKDQVKELKEQAEEYSNQITRMIRTRGVTVTPLSAAVANFGPQADAILTQIAGSKGIPKRLLLGSEMGQLASGQDADNWDTQVRDRRTSYAGPSIVRRFVDRLIDYNYFTKPKQYDIIWPEIANLTEAEKAGLANTMAMVNKTYGQTVFTDAEIREKCFDLEAVQDYTTDAYKAEGALKMAMVNKTMGTTIFTPEEIRKTWYDWAALPPSEQVPIGAPERITVKTPPPDSTDTGSGPDVAAPGSQLDTELAAKGKSTAGPIAAEAELLQVLEAAIQCNATDVIDRILGIKHLDTHNYACVLLNLPETIADKVRTVGNSVDYNDLNLEAGGREDSPHITVRYGLTSDDPLPVSRLLYDTGAVKITLGELRVFAGNEYDVLYARVESDQCSELHDLLTRSLDVVETHPEYIPHVCVAYLKPGLGAKYIGRTDLVGLTCHISEASFTTTTDDSYTIHLTPPVLTGDFGAVSFVQAPDYDQKKDPDPTVSTDPDVLTLGGPGSGRHSIGDTIRINAPGTKYHGREGVITSQSPDRSQHVVAGKSTTGSQKSYGMFSSNQLQSGVDASGRALPLKT